MKDGLFWIELVTTGNLTKAILGSDPNNDIILELSSAIIDSSLIKVIKGPNPILRATKEELKSYTQHKELIEESYKSTIGIKEVEQMLLNFLHSTVKDTKIQLAGKNCSKTRAFLRKFMPTFNEVLDYHNLDLRSLVRCCSMWNKKHFDLFEDERAEQGLTRGIEVLREIKSLLFK